MVLLVFFAVLVSVQAGEVMVDSERAADAAHESCKDRPPEDKSNLLQTVMKIDDEESFGRASEDDSPLPPAKTGGPTEDEEPEDGSEEEGGSPSPQEEPFEGQQVGVSTHPCGLPLLDLKRDASLSDAQKMFFRECAAANYTSALCSSVDAELFQGFSDMSAPVDVKKGSGLCKKLADLLKTRLDLVEEQSWSADGGGEAPLQRRAIYSPLTY